MPIVDHVLRHGGKRGIQAIVVYPMNALCNNQYGELEKFLRVGFAPGKEPVRFGKYTGQESMEVRDEMCHNPPDILLTNYVMLELLLTRPYERNLITGATNLSFLVLDELHSDIRLINSLRSYDLQGTMAAMGVHSCVERSR